MASNGRVTDAARSAPASPSFAGSASPAASLSPTAGVDPDLDLVPSAGSRGDDDLLARLTVDDEDLFVDASGQ